MINLIFARDHTNVIGVNNQLPGNIKSDLSRFKSLTHNRIIVMGRKTFESLGCKPLANRRNVVLTSRNYDNVETITDINKFLSENRNEEIFVIGGVDPLFWALEFADTIYETKVDHITENLENACIFGYPLPNDQFQKIYQSKMILANEFNEYNHVFNIYSRKKEI